MTAEIVPHGAELEIANATTEELRAELANALKLTAAHILRLALIWAELERRGEDLSSLRNGIGKYLHQVAYGKLLPETLVAFAGEPALLGRMSKLPVADQKIAVQQGSLPAGIKPIGRPRIESAAPTNRAVPSQPRPTTRESLPARRIGDMVGAASPKDVAEMCIEMIENSCNPKEVATRLMPAIEDLVGEAMAEDVFDGDEEEGPPIDYGDDEDDE